MSSFSHISTPLFRLESERERKITSKRVPVMKSARYNRVNEIDKRQEFSFQLKSINYTNTDNNTFTVG